MFKFTLLFFALLTCAFPTLAELRASTITYNQNLNYAIDSDNPPSNWAVPGFRWNLTPAVSCRDEDIGVIRDCRNDRVKNNLLGLANPMVIQSSFEHAIPDGEGLTTDLDNNIRPINIPVTNEKGEVFVVRGICYNQNTNSACDQPTSYDPNASWIYNYRLDIGFAFAYASLAALPSGTYRSVPVDMTYIDAEEQYIAFTVLFNMTFNIRQIGEEPKPDALTLHALQGETLPVFFSPAGGNNMVGRGSLDFCLESSDEDYSNLSMMVISDAPYLLTGEASWGKQASVFQLVNRVAEVGDASIGNKRRVLNYSVQSFTLGLRAHPRNDLVRCTQTDTRFCIAVRKELNLNHLPDTTIGKDRQGKDKTCKRFDITVITEPYDKFEKVPGDYSSRLYLTVDKLI